MEVIVKKSFIKSLKLTPKHIQEAVKEIVIPTLIKADSLQDTELDYKKMEGAKNDIFYRIRLGDWRLGIKYVKPNVIMIIILSRGNIYKHFP